MFHLEPTPLSLNKSKYSCKAQVGMLHSSTRIGNCEFTHLKSINHILIGKLDSFTRSLISEDQAYKNKNN